MITKRHITIHHIITMVVAHDNNSDRHPESRNEGNRGAFPSLRKSFRRDRESDGFSKKKFRNQR